MQLNDKTTTRRRWVTVSVLFGLTLPVAAACGGAANESAETHTEEIAEVFQAVKGTCKAKKCCWGRVKFKKRTLNSKKDYETNCRKYRRRTRYRRSTTLRGRICEEKSIPDTNNDTCVRECYFNGSKIVNKCTVSRN